MATLLTTSKMDPALAARIDASVRGRQPSAARTTRRIVALARFILVLTVGYWLYDLVVGRRENRREVEEARSALLAAVREKRGSLTAEDESALARAQSWLGRSAGAYEGDFVEEALRAPGALAGTLARPMIYVRAGVEALSIPAQISAAASASMKDSLLFCLLEPPASRAETVLLEKVRVVYAGGEAIESRTANVRRLHDAIAGLPLLLPPWSESVRKVEDRAELLQRRRAFERAPIERAKQAAKAALLLIAVDEPGDGKGPTELDGERPHGIRLVLVDVALGKVLLRARHLVDPARISPARRPTYASGLDGCAFAFDVHADVQKAAAAQSAGR